MAERAAAMRGQSLVEDFVAAAEAARDIAALNRLTGEAVRALGFDHFGIVHHVTYGRPSAGTVGLHSYPEEWLAVLRDLGRPPDPVTRAAERTACGFRWDRIDAIVTPTAREADYMAAAERHGIGGGFSVPNHVPGELPGSANFAVRTGRALPDRNLAAAQALGAFAFEAARRLTRAGGERQIVSLSLTERQRDCVLLVARGNSDAAIARRIGLKPRTVNEHVEAAKRRYGVATRTQLVVQALLRGEIAFGELAAPLESALRQPPPGT